MIFTRKYGCLVLSILCVWLSACSVFGNRKEKLAYVERPVELIYTEGLERMERGDWDRAALFFEDVERQHPFSEWARRAMLMTAYAKYRSVDYEESIAAAQRFISLHPGNQSTPYAYYLIALSYYDQIFDVGRDQATTVKAEEALQQIIRRYPDSDYARDARLKLELTHDHLAGKEMDIGRFYLRENQHLAAIGRFKNVIRQYEKTLQVEEALHRIVESYVALGIIEEATKVAAVLGYNYPQSRWYSDSYVLLTDLGVDVEPVIDAPKDKSYWRRLRERLF